MIVFCYYKTREYYFPGNTATLQSVTFSMPQKIDRKKFLQLALLSHMIYAAKPLQIISDTKSVNKKALHNKGITRY